ncbi:MAG TPA: CBS domain-containing protein [Chloroflexota bacterium]
MSRDAVTASPDNDLESAAQKMAGDEIRRLGVVENGILVVCHASSGP